MSPERNMIDKKLTEETVAIGPVLIHLQPSIIAPGRRVDVTIECNVMQGARDRRVRLRDSIGNEVLVAEDVQNNFALMVPVDLATGYYEVELQDGEILLDSVSLAVTDDSTAREAADFGEGLEFRARAASAIAQRDSARAIAFTRLVVEKYSSSDATAPAARALQELGSYLCNEGLNDQALTYLKEADRLFARTGDIAGRAAVRHLVGRAHQASNRISAASDDFNWARSAAAVSSLPLIEMRSLADLCSLTPATDERARLGYYNDFLRVAFDIDASSEVQTREAISLHYQCAKVVDPMRIFHFKKLVGQESWAETNVRIQLPALLEASSSRGSHGDSPEHFRSAWYSVLDPFASLLLTRLTGLVALYLKSSYVAALNVRASRSFKLQRFSIGFGGPISSEGTALVSRALKSGVDFSYFRQLGQALNVEWEISIDEEGAEIMSVSIPLDAEPESSTPD